MAIGRDRIRGMFLGGAIGDALFMPVETLSAEEIAVRFGRVTEYLRPDGHKWFDGRDAGTWTDDTQLTLAVAESMISSGVIKGRLDMNDMASKHVASYQNEGNLGFGSTTKIAIEKLAQGIHWSNSGRSDNPKHGTGNGVAMKVAPLGAFRASPRWSELLVEQRSGFIDDIAQLTVMTHYKRIAVESALAQVFAVRFCLQQESAKTFSADEFLEETMKMANMVNLESPKPLGDKIALRLKIIKTVGPKFLTRGDIIHQFGAGTSYVFDSLPFSYAFFLKDPGSIETLYNVGNAGGDTDTNASIVGSLLGALNGQSIFPQHLIDGLWQRDRIIDMADKFYNKFFTGR